MPYNVDRKMCPSNDEEPRWGIPKLIRRFRTGFQFYSVEDDRRVQADHMARHNEIVVIEASYRDNPVKADSIASSLELSVSTPLLLNFNGCLSAGTCASHLMCKVCLYTYLFWAPKTISPSMYLCNSCYKRVISTISLFARITGTQRVP